ncbi:hypothetical protein [Kitasatospora sp. NPDC088346]|uniref:hypothetical protein n=1 Tax=Kitasatospora sp. NPDC088346 TaxID=3364073 RepID=UPI00381EF719
MRTTEESGAAQRPDRLTIRVSRDGGRTYETTVRVRAEERLWPWRLGNWPECRCPQHRPSCS